MARAKLLTVHERMARVRQRDTAPELAVRQALTAAGIRYRICLPSLPGRPDIANLSRGWALFVHGCFWHGHAGCTLARLPRTNNAFWTAKIEANRLRDRRKEMALTALGLRVYTVWQCQLDDETTLSRLVSRLKDSR
jgi:DNA mismatch endonuclease (patch repair protein)